MAAPKLPSDKQKSILEFIYRYIREENRPPSYREIQNKIGASTPSVVDYHVRKLEGQGLLHRQPRVARGLSLTDDALSFLGQVRQIVRDASDVLRLRIQGDIRAGEPVDFGSDGFETYDEDDTVVVDAHLLPKRREKLALFRVRGDSMIDAHVQDGDLVVLQPVDKAHDGDMVAAWLKMEQELTLKHFHREGKRVRLQPANATMEPIYSPASNVQIQGKVVLVMRSPTA
ncbi:MAG: transcriptional repressor LexA [Chloroflexota bacterium]